MVAVLPMSNRAAESDNYLLYIGAGAIGGALVFNFLTGGVEALPFATSEVAGGTLWEGALAMNRVLTVGSAVVGIWLADKYSR
jgi:hypothetical protein